MPVRLAYVQIAVGEVAAPAAGDADFFCHFAGVVEQYHLQAALRSHAGTKEASRTSAHDQHIRRGGHAMKRSINSAPCAG